MVIISVLFFCYVYFTLLLKRIWKTNTTIHIFSWEGTRLVHSISTERPTHLSSNRVSPYSQSTYQINRTTIEPTNGTVVSISQKKRRNPLYVGPVENDIPLTDPYFDHHGNLSSFMEMYIDLHNNLTSSSSKQVVVYLPMIETGLGNSLLALSSSFIYAALTKRAFLGK